MNTHELRWWRRRSVIAVALLLVVAVALSALLLGRHEDDKGRMAVGDSLQGDYSLSDATYEHDLSFQVPGSVLSVSVAVGQRASSDETGGSVEAKAPRDGQLVHVTWSATRSSSDGAPDTGDHASRLAVRSRRPRSSSTGRSRHPRRARPRPVTTTATRHWSRCPATPRTCS